MGNRLAGMSLDERRREILRAESAAEVITLASAQWAALTSGAE